MIEIALRVAALLARIKPASTPKTHEAALCDGSCYDPIADVGVMCESCKLWVRQCDGVA